MAAQPVFDRRADLIALYRRTSTRERILLGGLALLGLVLAPVQAYDWSQSRLADLLSDKARLQAIVSSRDSLAVRRALRSAADERARVAAWTWSSPSFPVARVQLEEEAAAAAVRGGVLAPDVKSAELPAVVGGVAFVRVEMSGAFTWATMNATIQDLERSGKGFVLDSAFVEDDAAGARHDIIVAPAKFRLVLLMPVTLGAASDGRAPAVRA